jgi:hypothetical protein
MKPEQPYSNPLCPQWQLPQWGAQSYCETEFTYTFTGAGTQTLTVPAAGLNAQLLQFSNDAEFHITDWNVWGIGTPQETINTGLEVRLIDDTGKRRITNFVPVLQACGVVAADWVVGPGGVQRLDIRNTLGVSVQVVIAFRGYKRFQHLDMPPNPPGFDAVPFTPLWARYSAPPPGYVDEPYTYEFPLWNVTGPLTREVPEIPIPMDTDAPFLLRSMAVVTSVAVESTTSWAARLVTDKGTRLALNIGVVSTTIPFLTNTNFAGTVFTPTSGRYVYPELLCAAGSVPAVDLYLSVAAETFSGVLYLYGVKRHRIS